MNYEELFDKVLDIMVGDLPEDEASSAIDKLLTEQDQEVSDKIRATVAILFAGQPAA